MEESTFYEGKNLFSRANLFSMALYGLVQIDDAYVKLDAYVTFHFQFIWLNLIELGGSYTNFSDYGSETLISRV